MSASAPRMDPGFGGATSEEVVWFRLATVKWVAQFARTTFEGTLGSLM